MSVTKNRNEASRWLETAADDLDAAHILCDNGKYALACFHAQQAAEKAAKAIYYYHSEDPWGHSVTKLLSEIDFLEQADLQKIAQLVNASRRLDQFYIPTRYPNGVPDITPAAAFSIDDAQDALQKAEAILQLTNTMCDPGSTGAEA